MESFDDIMRQAFGDSFEASLQWRREISDLCARHGFPASATEQMQEAVDSMGYALHYIRTFAETIEREGHAGRGFSRELQAVFVRGVQRVPTEGR